MLSQRLMLQVIIPGATAGGAVSAFALGAAVVAVLGVAASQSGGGGGGGGGTDPNAGNAVRALVLLAVERGRWGRQDWVVPAR